MFSVIKIVLTTDTIQSNANYNFVQGIVTEG